LRIIPYAGGDGEEIIGTNKSKTKLFRRKESKHAMIAVPEPIGGRNLSEGKHER